MGKGFCPSYLAKTLASYLWQASLVSATQYLKDDLFARGSISKIVKRLIKLLSDCSTSFENSACVFRSVGQ
jgi:hypothetical protein